MPYNPNTMKIQSPKEQLLEVISLAPPEEQAALRDALKADRLTPALAVLIALKHPESGRTEPVADPKVAAKLDELLANTKEIAAMRANAPVPQAVEKNADQLMAKLDAVRLDLRGIEDNVATLRPYHRMKFVTALLLAVALGAAAGWYARAEYKSKPRTYREAY